jgi:hypothetical protein
MSGESYKAYNPESMQIYKLGDRLKQSFNKVNKIHGYVKEINSDLFEKYSQAFKRKLSEVVKDSNRGIDSNAVVELTKDLEYLDNNPEFVTLVMRYFMYELELETDFKDLAGEFEVTSFNDVREVRRLGYYLAKSCADIMGHDEGVKLWKKIVALQHRDLKIEIEAAMNKQEKPPQITMRERGDRFVKNWIDYGLADFARLDMDDHMVLFRFDKCLTPETMKELNDPEWAYLSSCYITDAPEFNFGPQRLRRTQTLHTASFCDEFYWDPNVYENPEQPSLELTENLGRSDLDDR